MNYYTTILLSIFTLITACNNQAVIPIENGKIKNINIQEKLGAVHFSVPTQDDTQSLNIIKTPSIDLTVQSNIWMTISHPLPLASYLQKLNPNAEIEEICNQGNYHFTIYLDGNKTYEQALNFGAGLLETKLNNKEISVPFASTQNKDSWGRYLWMRFMLMGDGEDAVYTAGKHTLKIEVRPYIEMPDQKIGVIISQGEVTLNVIKPVLTKSDIEVQPISVNNGWKLSKENINEKLIQDLNKRIGERYFKDITSIAIIKNGELLLEEYFKDANRATLHNPRSVEKTFASTIMGMVIVEGHITSVDAELKEFYDLTLFDNYAPYKERVTIKSLLKMSSGFNADNDN